METEWYYTASGAQQGPISEEELKGLIANGQLQPNAMVWRKGMADWLKPDQVPELASGSMPPADAAGPPQGGGGIPVQPAASQVASYPVPGRGPSQGLAIASFVCSLIGLLGFCFWCVSLPLAVAAIIMGHIALSKAKGSPQEFGGAGFAKAGLIIGYIGAAIGIVITILYFTSPSMFANEDFWKQIEEAQREAIEEAETSSDAE